MKKRFVLLFVLALSVSAGALAHHSDAGVDLDSEIWIEGSVTDFFFRNPHSYLTIQAPGPDGMVAEWKIQMSSPRSLTPLGWTRDTLQAGDNVAAMIHPAFDRPYGLLLDLHKDGEQMRGTWAEGTRRTYETGIATSLDGVWIGDRSTIGDFTEFFDRIVPTEKGRLAKAAFDPFSPMNPIVSCTPRPTPSTLVSSGGFITEFDFLEDGNITLSNEIFNTKRLIYMDGRQHPPMDERTLQGHSIGWWEGDTLVVDTTNFTDHLSPYQDGLPSGAYKHTLEKYRLTEDGRRVIVDLMLEDEEYIAEPLIHRMEWMYLPNETLPHWECDEESTKYFLPD